MCYFIFKSFFPGDKVRWCPEKRVCIDFDVKNKLIEDNPHSSGCASVICVANAMDNMMTVVVGEVAV